MPTFIPYPKIGKKLSTCCCTKKVTQDLISNPLHWRSVFIDDFTMKLTIERVRQFSAQDLIDLGKIWPQQAQEEWQPWLSADKALFAARFNDRLLAAVKVKITGKTAELSDLLVREVTRRRGVGLYLLEQVQQQLPEVDRWILPSADNDKELDAFMQACGFVAMPGGWQRDY